MFVLKESALAQSKPTKTIYGKVIALDSMKAYTYNSNVYMGGYKYFYDIYHVKVVTNNQDTIVVGKIFNILADQKELGSSFGIKKGHVYMFITCDINPCHSDFPQMCNCNYNVNSPFGEIGVVKGKIYNEPYSTIARIVYNVEIVSSLWEKLLDNSRSR